ncbi:hypothetical protein D3C73_362180 [compost metagenome]
MDHFQGVTPEERYKNDILNELRQIRGLLEQNAQLPKLEKGEGHAESKRNNQRRNGTKD